MKIISILQRTHHGNTQPGFPWKCPRRRLHFHQIIAELRFLNPACWMFNFFFSASSRHFINGLHLSDLPVIICNGSSELNLFLSKIKIIETLTLLVTQTTLQSLHRGLGINSWQRLDHQSVFHFPGLPRAPVGGRGAGHTPTWSGHTLALDCSEKRGKGAWASDLGILLRETVEIFHGKQHPRAVVLCAKVWASSVPSPYNPT